MTQPPGTETGSRSGSPPGERWRRPRLAAAIALVWLCAPGQARDAAAQDVDGDGPPAPSLVYDGPAIGNQDPPTAIARFGSAAAPWLWQVVQARQAERGSGARPPSRIALFEGAEGALYLVLKWRDEAGRRVEILRVALRDRNPEWRLVRAVDDGADQTIAALSGDHLFPGEPPVVVVGISEGDGGCGDHLRIIQLAGDTTEITPDFAGLPLRNLIDIDGDGVADAVLAAGLGARCRPGLGTVPALLRRVDGGFRPACTAFAGAYAAWLRELIAFVPYPVPVLLIDPYRDAMEVLLLAQAGRIDEAVALWIVARHAMPAEVSAALEGAGWPFDLEDWRRGRSVPLAALLDRARSMPGSGCPVTAAVAAIRDEWAAAGAADDDGPDALPSPAELTLAAASLEGVGRNPWIADDASDRPFARFGRDAAPWLPAALDRLAAGRDDAAQPHQVALLSGQGGRQYLAVGWDGDQGKTVDVYAVGGATGEGVAPRLLRSVFHDNAVIAEPTGTRPFPDLPPLLAVEESSMGSGGEGSLRLILLTGDTVDITPDWAGPTLGIRDLDGDGTPEVVTHDESFHGFPRGCGSCGPYLPIILRREAGRFVMACTDFRAIYLGLRQRIDLDFSLWAEGPELLDRIERLANAALLSAQAGAHRDADRAAERMVDAAESFYLLAPSRWTDWVPAVAHRIAGAVVRAADMDDGRGCPLSEVSGQRPYVPRWRDR